MCSSGTCTAKVNGAGFAVNCSSYTVPFSVEPRAPVNGTYDPASDPSLVNCTYAFMSFFQWNVIVPISISRNVQYKDTEDCKGRLAIRNCSLMSATVKYPVIVDGNRSTITLDPKSTIFDDAVLARSSSTGEHQMDPTVLWGFWLALNNKFASTSHIRVGAAIGYELSASQYAISSSTNASFGNCAIRFRDPTKDLLQEARKFMFQTAVLSANSSDTQLVSATQSATHAINKSHYQFLAAAICVTLLAIFLVFITFHGYWYLGRPVTMSPIELAKAINAPLLRSEDSNAKVETLVRRVGHNQFATVLSSKPLTVKTWQRISVESECHSSVHFVGKCAWKWRTVPELECRRRAEIRRIKHGLL
jgi:hypothetical protein